jgi:hypothetical protein
MQTVARMQAVSVAHERRSLERVPVELGATLVFHDGMSRWTETDAALVDLSGRGMFVRCDRVPGMSRQVVVRLAASGRGMCAAAGRPVRFDGWGGFAVRFERVNRPLTELVAGLARLGPGARAAALAAVMDVQIWIE